MKYIRIGQEGFEDVTGIINYEATTHRLSMAAEKLKGLISESNIEPDREFLVIHCNDGTDRYPGDAIDITEFRKLFTAAADGEIIDCSAKALKQRYSGKTNLSSPQTPAV